MKMNGVILIFCLAWVGLSFPTFQEYILMFEKSYTEAELVTRQKIYEDRLIEFQSITDYTPGINERTDWTNEELAASSNLQIPPIQAKNKTRVSSVRLGAATLLDWRTKKAVTSVKNQGGCGCCWAFATVAYAQSKLIIAQKYSVQNIDLSEQYMLQCTPNSNCNGGYLEYSILNVVEVPLEQNYPYSPTRSYSGICSSSNRIRVGYESHMLYDLSDAELINLLQTGPLAISISSDNWVNYGTGIFTCSQTASINHAVLLVGYTDSYWIIKNQWGTTWGESGYIRVTRNPSNNCKIGASASYLNENWRYIALALMIIIFNFL